MRSWSRDTWLGIAVLTVLVLFTGISAINQIDEATPPPLSSTSDAPSGAHALRLWFEGLGYTVSDQIGPGYAIPEGTAIVFILEPSTTVTTEEWELIDSWVESGGVLILAGEGFGAALASQHFDFYTAYQQGTPTELTAQTPLFMSPPLSHPIKTNSSAYFRTERSDFVTHLAAGERPVFISFGQGEGRVYLSATAYPLSNIGLKDIGNPALVLNLVANAAPPGPIWFDEWHHGVRASALEITGPEQWLRKTPAGRSLLYAALVIFAALLLRGRAFGRPVPLKRDITRRAPLEYIRAIANLNRRAGHREIAQRHYYLQLKRVLGQRYRINPTLPDKDYVSELVRFRPNLDGESLLTLLGRLKKQPTNEKTLVELAREAAEWIERR